MLVVNATVHEKPKYEKPKVIKQSRDYIFTTSVGTQAIITTRSEKPDGSTMYVKIFIGTEKIKDACEKKY
jgi:hypothetical protein